MSDRAVARAIVGPLLLCCVLQIPASAEPQSVTASPVTFFFDPDSGITLKVEPDGRHVVATNRRGETLWRTDPFTVATLKPYRTPKPVIVYLGPMRGDARSASIRFSSTQFGSISLDDGKFQFLGQD